MGKNGWTSIILVAAFQVTGCGAHWRNQPQSCRAAAIQAGVDGYNGTGVSQQQLMLQNRCTTDRAIAAANQAHAEQMAQLQEIERQRAEAESRRQAQELALAQAEAELARARADEARARAEAVGTSGVVTTSSTATAPVTTVRPRVLLFGGRDHKTYLGCACDESDPDSIFNKYGEYGSRYGIGASIWNKYGDYGSKYSDTSACNKYASYPPILVSETGEALGYLTLDRYKLGAIDDPAVLDWLDKVVCEN